MNQWPPSPIVEDEQSSLARELHSPVPPQQTIIEEHKVPSRGSVDQNPIIIESHTSESVVVENVATPIPSSAQTPERAVRTSKSCSIDPRSGLATPPASDSEVRGRSTPVEQDAGSKYSSRAKSVAGTLRRRKSSERPAIARIHTDVNKNLTGNVKPDMRRAWSPYAYSRDTGTIKVTPDGKRDFPSDLSHAMVTSPTSMSDHQSHSAITALRDHDSSTDSDRRSKQSARRPRDTTAPEGLTGARLKRGSHSTAPRFDDRADLSRESTSEVSSRSRRRGHSRGAPSQLHEQEPKDRRRQSRSHSRRAEPNVTGPDTYTATSGEYSSKDECHNCEKQGNRTRRRSSHRRERPRFLDPTNDDTLLPKPVFSDCEDMAQGFRPQNTRSPMTPPSINSPISKEDYFNRSLALRSVGESRYTPRSSTEEAVVFWSPNSPPQSPAVERMSTQDYYPRPKLTSQRSPRSSRPPSWDEAAFRELQSPNSLLSQATLTTAVATRASPSSMTSFDTSSTTPPQPQNMATRPVPISPASGTVPGISRSNTSIAPTEEQMSRSSDRENTRLSARDGSGAQPFTSRTLPYQPQRITTWTGYDQRKTVPQQYGPSTVVYSPKSPTNSLLPPAPPLTRSKSINNASDLSGRTPVAASVLPMCPRSQPTRGSRDWYTLRDASQIDLCPSCTEALSVTRLGPLLKRSLDRPYDRYTACSLSDPWIRIAMLATLKTKQPKVSLVKKVACPPEGVRACEGSTKDVRIWWKLRDPMSKTFVSDFWACSACTASIHAIYPDLPDIFERDVVSQEKTCSFDHSGPNFASMVSMLDAINQKCHERENPGRRHMQPFVDLVRKARGQPVLCSRDTMLAGRAWHFAPYLPEFTVCEDCYDDIIYPMRDKYFASDISPTKRLIPSSHQNGILTSSAVPTTNNSGPGVSCQLYSERMRRLFADVHANRISFETFRARVRERVSTQQRLWETNRMYEEDQRTMGWDRRSEIERNLAIWRGVE